MTNSDQETDSEHDSMTLTTSLKPNLSLKKQNAKGFALLGLSDSILRAVKRKGYNLPTPIQRKAIPIALSGRDVVAMARTGSGKTAAFLLPMLEKLKQHSPHGARALILSPTRELALQTLTFLRELGKFTNLNAVGILGGDRLEDQFSALHKNPDIIVATPGRLLHIVMEMDLKLKSIEYVVFDEGDRLFELGFSEQLSETLNRLSPSKQTLVFSATLPTSLVEFTRAKLTQPVLIRLDVENKISEQLKLTYFTCLDSDKSAALLHLLRNFIPVNQQAVVFFATKHHAEYLQSVMEFSNLSSAIVHSGLDSSARTSVVADFRAKKIRFLMVTDLAARGIDMPFLDNVVNYHFPAQAKLFIHRVGRVARAGRTGTAFSLVDPEETPYLFDTLTFLGRQLAVPTSQELAQDRSDMIGKYPRVFLSQSQEMIVALSSKHAELDPMKECSERAYKKYTKTKQKASSESVKRAKMARVKFDSLPSHPLFVEGNCSSSDDVLSVLRNVRVPTIFEALGKTSNNVKPFEMMARKNALHGDKIAFKRDRMMHQQSGEDSIFDFRAAKDKQDTQQQFFVPYEKANFNRMEEQALSVNPDKVALDVNSDHLVGQQQQNRGLVWDRKKKRFTGADALAGQSNVKKIRTESGAVIPASYKTNKYQEWMKKSKVDQVEEREERPVEKKERPAFVSSYSAKFGSVVEFLDDPEEGAKAAKKHWRPGMKKEKPMPKKEGPGLRVLGMFNRKDRAARNRRENQEKKQAHGIRQATVDRHHGQVRKAEVVLKARKRKERIRIKMNKGSNKKKNKTQTHKKRR
ncbi:ATP-dependent RNA helicase ddx54 [Cichlidogyrus casuarinus]|uniref:RNA helicase n=1 Tax=Cichlidogyrus casuarinus TaxID=1844966 RepID=A0ABD2Q319_9PLAT